MNTLRLPARLLLVLLALSLSSIGCSLDQLRDASRLGQDVSLVSIGTVTYNWTRRTASLTGAFAGSGRVNGFRVVVGEKVGDEVIMWFDDVYYVRRDVTAGDPLACTSYDVKPPQQQAFEWKAVVTDVF